MSEKITSINELASRLSSYPSEFSTIGDVVDALVDLGKTDKVYVYHDSHIGLKIDLSSSFLRTSIEDADSPEFEEKFEEETDRVLSEANTIIPLSKRTLSEDDMDDIEEERARLGLKDD